MKEATDPQPEHIEGLINELMKEKPNQSLVRRLMLKNGIPYSPDPIIQMGQILAVMNEQPLVDNRLSATGSSKIRKGESQI